MEAKYSVAYADFGHSLSAFIACQRASLKFEIRFGEKFGWYFLVEIQTMENSLEKNRCKGTGYHAPDNTPPGVNVGWADSLKGVGCRV
ncbi:MAG: hypothetical protein Kow0027_10870 [Saprospiraceae bacterium]